MSISAINILLVDDSIINLELIKMFLESFDYNVVCAVNGQEAIEQFSEALFDVVLMDINMPVMDGIEATQVIRRIELVNNTQTPIIALTASDSMADQAIYQANNMNALAAKPIKPKELLKIIHQVIARFQQGNMPFMTEFG